MMPRIVKKSIAIIGEGDTEWFYFESMRVYRRLPLKIDPSLPSHSDVSHMFDRVKTLLIKQYDYVICLIDMDRLLNDPTEMEKYRQAKRKYSRDYPERALFVETNPCTEFWFLLHFLPTVVVREYSSSEQLLQELTKYMPGYEKTAKYFNKTNLYKYLTENGDLNRAMQNAEKLREICKESPEDTWAYSEIYKVFQLIDKCL